MIRLLILKKKGGNIRENINIIKKKKNKNQFPTLLPKIKQALSILEDIEIKKRLKNFFIKLRAKSMSMHTKKITLLFFQIIIKFARKINLKKIFKILINYFSNHINYREILNKNKNNLLVSPIPSLKKSKKFKVHNNKNIKVQLMTKKVGVQKKGGYEKIIEYQKKEKEKEMEKLKQETNVGIGKTKIINKKLQKLDSLNRIEKEYLSKIRDKKKKLQNEINIFRKNTNISEEGLSQIKHNNLSDKDSSFFSKLSSNELGTYDFKPNSSRNKDFLSEVLSSNENDYTSNQSNIIKMQDGNKVEDEMYSFKSNESKKTPLSKKELNYDWSRKSVKNLNKKNIERIESKKSLRFSIKLKEPVNKKKVNEPVTYFDLKNKAEMEEKKKENKSLYEDKELDKEDDEENEESEEEENEEEEEDSMDEHFIKVPDQEED